MQANACIMHTDCCHECFVLRTMFVCHRARHRYKSLSIVCWVRLFVEFLNHSEPKYFHYIYSNVWIWSSDCLNSHRDLLHWMWWMLRLESNAQKWIPSSDPYLSLKCPRMERPQWIPNLNPKNKTIIVFKLVDLYVKQ